MSTDRSRLLEATLAAALRARAPDVVAHEATVKEALGELYHRQRMPLRQLATLLDLDPTETAHVLRDMGVGARPPASRQRERADVARDDLVDLYVRQHLSTEAIGDVLGVSNNTVLDRLRTYGIPVRPQGGGRRPLVAKDVLEDLYIRQDLPLEEVARRLEVPVERVAASRRAHGLPVQGRKGPPLPRAQLEELYVQQGLSVEEVAARTHASRGRVTRDMDRYGMARRPPGPKRAGPH